MSNIDRDDVDWATAAEQSSEEDEAQEGNMLEHDEHSSDAAEHVAMHVVDEVEVDLDAALDALAEANDPEADAVVNDALDIDSVEEAEAALEAVTEEEVLAEDDPYEAFKAELRFLPGKWYVIHSYAGFERKVKANLLQRMESMADKGGDDIFQVEVPMEDVMEIKNGQRKMVTRVRVPSYVLVRMDLNPDSWSVVRQTPGVTGFVGNAHDPAPLRFDEAFNMLKPLVEVAPAAPAKAGGKAAATGGAAVARTAPVEIDFELGETINIKEGSFEGLPGTISEIKPESGKLTVLVSLFERETPVELSFDQVAKI
ncbi:MAG: transcription termination/antitermination protein NusG [Microbacteriaceae bacterium]